MGKVSQGLKKVFVVISLIGVLSSCAGSQEFSKRKYRKGRHFESIGKTKVNAIKSKKEEVIVVKSLNHTSNEPSKKMVVKRELEVVNSIKISQVKTKSLKEKRPTFKLKRKYDEVDCKGQFKRVEAKFNKEEYQFPKKTETEGSYDDTSIFVAAALIVLGMVGLVIGLFHIFLYAARKEVGVI